MFLSIVFLAFVTELLALPLSLNHIRGHKSRSILPITVDVSPSIVESISAGSQMAIEHCQQAFQWERWNCPRTTFTRQQKLHPTRETAYAKAIVAAAIVHVITKNCSRGEIKGCGCNTSLNGSGPLPLGTEFNTENQFVHEQGRGAEGVDKETIQWSWGGCSDDTSYAVDVANKFLDSLEKGLDAAAYVARHNSRIGRQIIRDTMVRKCRCHGISGSCTLQTCWMQVAPFGEVSRKLKERYRNSERLTRQTVEKYIYIENSLRGMAKEKTIPEVKHSLVFLEQSPDYCIDNLTEGFLGTKGRICSRKANYTTVEEKNSCRNLCKRCGYRVERMTKTVTKRCNCKFDWCCEVKCDTCRETVDEHFCV